MNHTFRTVVSFVALLCGPGVADACSVPVFRYALDHWTPDAYRLLVVHDGPLTAEQIEIVQRFRDQVSARFANATVEDIDVTDNPAFAHIYGPGESGPRCFVFAPTADPKTFPVVWSGPLSTETVDAILGSPARDRIIKSLLDGTSVVWIYLDSGVTPVDDANFSMLETELARLQGVIDLPEIDPVDLKELSTSPDDVKLQFTALRLSRDNAEEAALVDMLLSTEPDLRDATFIHEPMAFPIFGRGRVLYSLVGQGITAELIEEACRFLTGACQCTVKAQNPGVDLLLSVDWDGLTSPAAPTEIDVTLTGLAGFQSDSAPAAATPPPAVTTEPVASQPAPDTSVVAAVTPEVDAAAPDIDPAPEAAPSGNMPVIRRRPEMETAFAIRPGVLITILGLVVVVASFFLIPRR